MAAHFISYSRRRDRAFALRLYRALEYDRPNFVRWIDERELARWQQYGRLIKEAIAACEAVLFVWSRDSETSTHCRRELGITDFYHKPVLVLRIDPEVDVMYEIAGWPTVDFTGDFQAGLDELYHQLDFLNSPAGELLVIDQQLELAERDLIDAPPAVRSRVESDIEALERARHHLKPLTEDPGAARTRADQHIRHGQERDRAAPAADAVQRRIRYVTSLPQLPPDRSHFQDRIVQTERLREFLQDENVKAVMVSGAAGFGKTAMVARFAGALEPDAHPVPVDAVIYLSAHGVRPVSPAVLLESLIQATPGGGSDDLASLLRSHPTVVEKLEALAPDLLGMRLLLIIDSLEDLVDPVTRELRDAGLDSLLTYLLGRDDLHIKMVLIARERLGPLQERFAGDIRDLPLDVGLPVADARRLLERLDADGTLGIALMEPGALDRMCERTSGHPRALEALYAVLRHNRRASLEGLLEQTARLGRDAVVGHLIGEMFNQLYRHERRVVEALALYGQPVSAAAVDHLLQPYVPGEESELVLSRLVELRLVRQDGPTDYYLPSPDSDLLLERIRLGEPGDGDRQPPRFTKAAMWPRAADYFAGIRRGDVKQVGDLRPQLAEIPLRIRGGQLEEAFGLIDDVDSRYLSRWGWSDLLSGYRRCLVDRLDDPVDEILNLDGLAKAEEQRDDLTEAIAHYRAAIDVARQNGRLDMVAGLRVNLGSAQYSFGRSREARRSYEEALLSAEEYLSPEDKALALSGIAICDAEGGELDRAIEHGNRALTLARKVGLRDQECTQLLNTGRMYGQLGEEREALERLQQGLELAHRRGDRAVEGRCLDAVAEMFIDQGRVGRAIDRAKQAVEIGEQVRRPELISEASTTLALAYLCSGGADGLEAAQAAIDTASANRRARRTLNAPVLAGIIALRREDRATAGEAFDQAEGDARGLLLQDDHRFDAFDALGIAYCGLAVVGEDVADALEQAAAAFKAARAVTTAPGLVRRVIRLLDELEEVAPHGLLKVPRQSATGEPGGA
jgi:tetratricopeptide (TPR) repeat protein